MTTGGVMQEDAQLDHLLDERFPCPIGVSQFLWGRAIESALQHVQVGLGKEEFKRNTVRGFTRKLFIAYGAIEGDWENKINAERRRFIVNLQNDLFRVFWTLKEEEADRLRKGA